MKDLFPRYLSGVPSADSDEPLILDGKVVVLYPFEKLTVKQKIEKLPRDLTSYRYPRNNPGTYRILVS